MENNEEKIETQIMELERILEAPQEQSKKRKYDFYMELVLFLVLGILIGVALKTEAVKRITMGFDDYKMKIMKQDFDINKIEEDILKKQAENVENNPEQNQENNNQAVE
ncbi:MAG TPA: hypothetical protein P5232_04390 [Candidatus Moranbacteria bacterium]|nr:hypothetical protein [Candidatus Moranbacteria bacterium]